MDSLSQDLLAELECPVCYETMLPPIRLCMEGHSLCNHCYLKLRSCPTCKSAFTNTRNRALEGVSRKFGPASSGSGGSSRGGDGSARRAKVSLLYSHTTLKVEQDFEEVGNASSRNTKSSPRMQEVDDDDDEDEEDSSEDDGSDSNVTGQERNTVRESTDTVYTKHDGVTCDVCKSGVDGPRYKCLQCDDYDLCTICEGKQLHSNHYILRMPTPVFWCQHFSRSLGNRMINEISTVLSHLQQRTGKHRRTVCDGCDVKIRGFQYKCLQCDDYDLCSSCEGRSIHSAHFMIRMPFPITSWDDTYGKTLAEYINKSANEVCEGGHKNFRPLEDSRIVLKDKSHHCGVTCDVCRSAIHGFRYKCLQCFNYDLCSTCEGAGNHEHHYVLRMPDPKDKCQHIGRRLGHRMLNEVFDDCCNEGGGHRALRRKNRLDGDGHGNVICDGCHEDIYGFRYKCLMCPNLDLCAGCERNFLHKKHFMIRMPFPTVLCTNYSQRLLRDIRSQVCRNCT